MVQLRSWMIPAEACPGTFVTLKGACGKTTTTNAPSFLFLSIIQIRDTYSIRGTRALLLFFEQNMILTITIMPLIKQGFGVLELHSANMHCNRNLALSYRGSPPYAFFGTWKKPCYMKLVLVGLYCGPLLTLKFPHLHVHKPKNVLVETVLVIFV